MKLPPGSTTTRFRLLGTLLLAATSVVGVGTGVAHAAGSQGIAGCAGPSGGGDWRSYGHDLSNTRTPSAETTLGTAAASGLSPAWSAQVAPTGPADATLPATQLNGTPVVADGCVFVGAADGHVTALNAETGAVVWRSAVLGDAANPGLGGLVVGSVAVEQGRVFVLVNQLNAPLAVALNEATGRQ